MYPPILNSNHKAHELQFQSSGCGTRIAQVWFLMCLALVNILNHSLKLCPIFLPFFSMQKVIIENTRAPAKKMKGSKRCDMVRGVSVFCIFGLVQKFLCGCASISIFLLIPVFTHHETTVFKTSWKIVYLIKKWKLDSSKKIFLSHQ